MVKKDKDDSGKVKISGIFERAGKELKNIKEKEKKSDIAFLHKRLESKSEGETKQLEYKREQQKKEYKKERAKTIVGAISQKAEALSNIGQRILSKPMLKKPHAKVPSYSATKFIQKMAGNNMALVREVERPEIVQDSRSLYFNAEQVKARSWLFKD